ncbi:NfeD family protein [Neotabrizicola sp. sgz301269]|uniref:NfeD family protein n=1 Tax=Neotabrizicola sp. sgz301269 TaxID=3276282 RepID=UPI00376F883B
MPDQIWTIWWAWVVLGFALGVLEILAPGYIFLGFAIGAALTGVLVGLGLAPGLPALILIFAVLSLVAWLGLRASLGKRAGQVKTWDRDINDNP